MASGSFNLESDISTLQGKIVWSSSSNGSAANSSTVTATLYVARTDSYTTTGTWEFGFNVGGSTAFESPHTSVSSSWVAMKTITNSNVAHNADGTGTCFIEGYCIGPEGTSMAGHAVSGSQTVNLDRIPRYATSNQSLNSKTVNSIKMNWSSDSTIDYIWYSINNGSSWTAVGSVNASSGNYTISGLSPNTAYNIKTRVRRKDSQLTTDSSVLSVTTYQIATLASVPNVNIGAEQTITWNNPGSSAISLKLCKTDNTQIINYGTVTGTSKKVTPTASTIYALTPNSNTYTARYILTTTVNGTNYTNSKDFVFTVTNSNPTFSNFTFKNVNITTYNGNKKLDDLTGSDQILVKGFSNVQATISDANKAVARNSATLKSYSLTIGSKSATNSTLSYPLNMTANAVDNSNIVVAAVDSRGNSTKVTKTATYKAYTDLIISSLTATRSNNGVGTTLTIAFNGTFWNSSFGSISNTIVSATYKYRKTTDTSWSSEIAVTPTISGGNYSASITPNITFDVESSYYIYLTVKDYLETKTYQITVGAGTPALAIYKDRVSVGGKYDTGIGEKFQVHGTAVIDNVIAHNAGGTAGSAGYVKFATINITGGYQNAPLEFAISRRGDSVITRLNVQFSSSNPATSTTIQNFRVVGATNAFWIHLESTGSSNRVFALYAQKTEGYDSIGIVCLHKPKYDSGITITWTNVQASSLPTSNITQASWGGNIGYAVSAGSASSATSATKATQDSDGVQINTSYSRGGGKEGSSIFTAVGSGQALQRSGLYSANDGTWYNLINIRHRNGEGDGPSYGMQFISALTTANAVLQMRKQTNGSWTSWEQLYRAKSLYENSSGNTGTVTLSESAANFTFIEIFYLSTSDSNVGYSLSSTKVWGANGKGVWLTTGTSDTTNFNVKLASVKVNGTSITKSYGYMEFNDNRREATNYIGITKVVGYR